MLRLRSHHPRILALVHRNLALIPSMMSQVRSNATTAHAEDDVLFSNKNLARVIALNRPKKLNSLNTLMVTKITPRLLEYLKSASNSLVVLTLTSPKGLCAGGDVAECARQIVAGNPGYGSDFFQQEYNLNYLILTYLKPYIALMDGITMGGGVGLSVHAPFRVSTERTKLAMPEMDIGFFPDVGTTFFLPRLDEKVGYYVALTGAVLSGLDAYLLGFATHYVPSDRLDALVARLLNLQPPTVAEIPAHDNHKTPVDSTTQFYAQVNEIIDEFAENRLPEGHKYPFSPEELKVINTAFSQPSVEEILLYLKNEGSEFALKTFYTLQSKPPSSLKVAYELLNRGASNSIKKQFELELVSATNIMNTAPEKSDFVKGVSHKLIDKIKEPKNPQWVLAENPQGISPEWVESVLSPSIASAKLETPLIQRFFGVDFKEYPHHMGLPLNKQVEEYITGNDGSGRSYLPTPSEVVKHFSQKTGNKLGVETKVQSILAVHGEASKYNDKYVSWVN